MKKSFKLWLNIALVMTLVLSLNVSAGAATDESQDQSSVNLQDYAIVEANNDSVTNLQFKQEGTENLVVFNFLEHNVKALASFYELEGAALSANTYLADVKESNYEILHLSVSTAPRLLDKDITLKDGEILLNLAIVIPNDNTIYQVSQPVNRDSVILEIINDSKALNLDKDKDHFTKLYQTELWWVPLLNKMNAKKSGYQEVPVDPEAPNLNGEPKFGILAAPTITGDSSFPITPYINANSFTTTGVYKLEITDVNGKLVRGYIRESYAQPNGTIVTLAALFDFSHSVALPPGGPNNSRVAYIKATRAHNIFGLYNPSTNIVQISYAPSNSTYVFTREPRIAMKITGSGTGGYFEQYRFGQHVGATPSSPWMSVQTTLLGLRYPQLSVPITAYNLIKDNLDTLSGRIYNAAANRYEITPAVNNQYAKNIGSILDTNFYNRYGQLDATGIVVNYSAGTNSRTYFQYETEHLDINNTKWVSSFYTYDSMN